MEEDLADLVPSAGMSAKDGRRFTYKKNASDTSASLLQYYSQIPLEWIDIPGRMLRANFEMFGYSLPEPLKSLYERREHSRAQTLPAMIKCGDLSMGCLSPNCKMVVIFVPVVQCCHLCCILGEEPYRANPV